MAAVYSRLLARGNQSGAGGVNIYTAPSGVTIVVKHIALLTLAGSTGGQIDISGVGTLAFSPGGAAQLMQQTYGQWVLDPGDVLQATFFGTGGQWYLSGYELQP